MIKLKMTSRKVVISDRKSAGRTYSGFCDKLKTLRCSHGFQLSIQQSWVCGQFWSRWDRWLQQLQLLHPHKVGFRGQERAFLHMHLFLGNQEALWNPCPPHAEYGNTWACASLKRGTELLWLAHTMHFLLEGHDGCLSLLWSSCLRIRAGSGSEREEGSSWCGHWWHWFNNCWVCVLIEF